MRRLANWALNALVRKPLCHVRAAAFPALSAISLLLAIAVACVWRCAYFQEHETCRDTIEVIGTTVAGTSQWYGYSSEALYVGKLRDYATFNDTAPAARYASWSAARRKISHAGTEFSFVHTRITKSPARLMDFDGEPFAYQYGNVMLSVPFSALFLVTAFLPIICLMSRIRRSLVRRGRRARGECQACGYDVRATPGKCPECGRMSVASTAGAV